MQADNNINNLFKGFENEFGKGDWSAIESKVLDNNRKFRLNQSKFKIGATVGLAACLVLGLVHFNTATFSSEEQKEVAEIIEPIEESQLIISTDIDRLPSIQSATIEEKLQPNESVKESRLKESKISESSIVQKPILKLVNEKIAPQLPKFIIQKTTYCIGEKLAFITDSKSTENVFVKWNNKKMTLDEFKQFRLTSAGETTLQVLENDEIIQEFTVACQAPTAKIGFKKNYDIGNPYVNFSAMNASENADYKWYVDGEPIATEGEFEHTFASKGMYSVKMVVKSSAGCKDSSIKSVRILRAYNLMATTVYNPKEGKWLPLGLKKDGVIFRLRIINQEGETVFTSTNPNNEWDGSTAENKEVSNGDLFYWVAQVTASNGKISEYGNSLLINSKLE